MPHAQLPKGQHTIVAVIPVYNEGKVVRQVVESLLQQQVHYVVIVDDGSAVPVQHALQGLPVTVLRHRINLGQGASLQTAFAYAKRLQPDIVITFDADGQHHAPDIPQIIAPIVQREADVVFGSRFLSDKPGGMGFSKKMVLRLARWINFLLSGVLLSDAHNGFRALGREALEKIELTENRMAHATEILFETRRHKLRYCEVPVHVRYTEYSRQKGQPAHDSIKILFDLVLHKLFK